MSAKKSQVSNVLTKSFKESEIEKLKSVLASCRVIQQHISDLNEQMKELVKEAADDLDIKPSEITKAARALYKNDLANKKAQYEVLEELLQMAGYDTSGDVE